MLNAWQHNGRDAEVVVIVRDCCFQTSMISSYFALNRLVYRSSRLSTIGHQFQRHQLTQQLDVIRRQPAQWELETPLFVLTMTNSPPNRQLISRWKTVATTTLCIDLMTLMMMMTKSESAQTERHSALLLTSNCHKIPDLYAMLNGK